MAKRLSLAVATPKDVKLNNTHAIDYLLLFESLYSQLRDEICTEALQSQ